MVDPKLYTLLSVVEHGSYTRAAEKLSLTQPAVSQHIRQLERELGIKIFNRVGNSIKPTSEGLLVIQYARRNIALYQKMLQSMLDERHRSRRFTVGITHTSESNAVAEALGKYSAKNLGTVITIITDSINNLNNMLRNYEIDLAVIEGTRNLFTAHLESNNLSLNDFNVILEVDNIATIKDLIRRDIGVSILARSVCLDELKKGEITVLPIENLSMIREVNILYHNDFKHKDILQGMMKEYENVVGEYV